MNELIENLANNNTVIIGLGILLGVLVIAFIALLFTGKGKKTKKEEVKTEEPIAASNANNIDFDHGEYVKETTAEFELTPITEVKPVPDEYMPNVNFEESPAIDKSKNIDDIPLADFNFDDLSKSISEELDKLKDEEAKINSEEEANVTPDTSVVDAFAQAPEAIPVETPKVEEPNINFTDNVILPTSEPTFITDVADINVPEVKVETPEIISDEPTMEQPIVRESVTSNPAVSEPVIKEEDVPLFARFNQETYDLNGKD